MKRKIMKKTLVISVVSMFLLTGLTALSAVGIKTNNTSINNPPPTPPRPNGQPIVIEGNGAFYYFVAGEKDTPWEDYDDICFNFSWGDGTYTGWFGPGTHPHKWHDWETSGIYKVKIKAKRVPGDYESEWSKPLIVTVIPDKSKSTSTHPAFLRLFDLFPNAVQLFQRLLKS